MCVRVRSYVHVHVCVCAYACHMRACVGACARTDNVFMHNTYMCAHASEHACVYACAHQVLVYVCLCMTIVHIAEQAEGHACTVKSLNARSHSHSPYQSSGAATTKNGPPSPIPSSIARIQGALGLGGMLRMNPRL